MSLQPHKYKILDDDGSIYYNLPATVIFPEESSKYWEGTWLPDYDLFRLSYFIYGDVNLFWLILEANDIVDPWSLTAGEKFKILLPEFLNEVVFD